jgi:hypothetical protein
MDIWYEAAIKIRTSGKDLVPNETFGIHEFLGRRLNLERARLALEVGLELIKEEEKARRR